MATELEDVLTPYGLYMARITKNIARGDLKILRLGQLYFNTLHDMHPGLANRIRNTPIDPFHNEGLLHAFLQFVEYELDHTL